MTVHYVIQYKQITGTTMRKMLILLLLLAILSPVLCQQPYPDGARIARALTVELTTRELLEQADWVVVGTVKGQTSEWTDGRRTIRTLVTFEVDLWLKGKAVDPNIVIKIPGGTAAGITEWVEDAARFAAGERVLLFLEVEETSSAWTRFLYKLLPDKLVSFLGVEKTYFIQVVGGMQGKYPVEHGKVVNTELTPTEFISQIGNH